jgi:hypothetical protein
VDILMGILLVVLGLIVAFMGIQVFFATLPLLGFLFGFFAGASGVESIFGDGFLGTASGWIFGIVAGLIFAFIAWFWWYAGVLVSAGALGAVLGTGLAEAIGIDNGFVLFVFGLVGFVALMAVAFVLDLPIYLVILNTAGVGATALITGVLLLFNRLDYDELAYGSAVSIINESWWWALTWFVVAVLGIAFQLTMKASVHVPEERWVNAGTVRPA